MFFILSFIGLITDSILGFRLFSSIEKKTVLIGVFIADVISALSVIFLFYLTKLSIQEALYNIRLQSPLSILFLFFITVPLKSLIYYFTFDNTFWESLVKALLISFISFVIGVIIITVYMLTIPPLY
jgi:hypothetical protein